MYSSAFEKLHLQEVVLRVLNDARTAWEEDPGITLGYPFNVIRDSVIKRGLADFREGHDDQKYGRLSADDKVLLYCITNMKLHLFESHATFQRYAHILKTVFDSRRTKLVFDLGCGPGTAGLALAEWLGSPLFTYVGLDHSEAMLRKARSLLQTAIALRSFARTTQIVTSQAWETLLETIRALSQPTNILVNATYFFASASLNVKDVSKLLRVAVDCPHVRRLYLTYSNSHAPVAGTKFVQMKQLLKGSYTTDGLVTAIIQYRKKRAAAASPAKYACELLRFKED